MKTTPVTPEGVLHEMSRPWKSITELRKARKKTLEAVAIRLEITAPALSRKENGVRRFLPHEVQALAELYQVPVEVVLDLAISASAQRKVNVSADYRIVNTG